MKSYRLFHTIKSVSQHPENGRIFYSDIHPIHNFVDNMSTNQLHNSMSKPTKETMGNLQTNIVNTAMDKRKKLIDDIDSDKMPGFYYNKKHDIFYSYENELKNNGYKTANWDVDKTVVVKDKNNEESSMHGYSKTFIDQKSNEIKKMVDQNMTASEEDITQALDITKINSKKIQTMTFDSGLSMLLKYEDSYQNEKGLIFDFGDLNVKQEMEMLGKYIKYFEDIDEICFILSHHHHDHYSMMAQPMFGTWVKTKKTTLITYRPLDSLIVARYDNIFDKVLVVPYMAKKYQVGQYILETFEESKNINATSMTLIKNGECAFTGDQLYVSIPSTEGFEFFQVPHHGSDHNGNYMTIENNKVNYVPNGLHWGLPKTEVVEYVKNKDSLLLNPIEAGEVHKMFGMQKPKK